VATVRTIALGALLDANQVIVLNPKKKYNLEYYLDVVEKIVKIGTHTLGIKDMAGVLKPKAARMLVGAIRKKYPDLPIHVHTHDSAGTGNFPMSSLAQVFETNNPRRCVDGCLR